MATTTTKQQRWLFLRLLNPPNDGVSSACSICASLFYSCPVSSFPPLPFPPLYFLRFVWVSSVESAPASSLFTTVNGVEHEPSAWWRHDGPSTMEVSRPPPSQMPEAPEFSSFPPFRLLLEEQEEDPLLPPLSKWSEMRFKRKCCSSSGRGSSHRRHRYILPSCSTLLHSVDEDEGRYWRDEKRSEQLAWSDNCTTVNSQLVQSMIFHNGQDALMKLWKASFPEINLTGLVSEQWKEMGWQGPNPSTDFRGCGFVSLENLLFFARTYPASYQRLLFKQGGVRATWEYPFAVAGINISFMLIQMLDLYSGQ
ncbi:hypothetical protein Taro_049682 [Colocasia esculenta]|uniref:ELMO domain-containing protein n=1 Tax=Colocasia esculenta TaxID=4460 RepID=A0A843XBE6_COLES|nr:hypothetical protein [Colocasia esculenta]